MREKKCIIDKLKEKWNKIKKNSVQKIMIIAILFAFIAMICYPIIVHILYSIGNKYPLIVTEFKSSEMLTYGVTLLGSIIALLGGIITIYIQRQDKKEETKRSVMPMLKVSNNKFNNEYNGICKDIYFDFKYTDKSNMKLGNPIFDNTQCITISIKNVGSCELYELYVGDFDATFFVEGGNYYKLQPVVYAEDFLLINFVFYEAGIYDNDPNSIEFRNTYRSTMNFNFYYKDCLENWYTQKLALELLYSYHQNTSMKKLTQYIDMSSVEICSSPQEISEEQLPWVKNTELLFNEDEYFQARR